MIKVEFKLDYCSASILFHERFFLKRRLNKFSKLIIKFYIIRLQELDKVGKEEDQDQIFGKLRFFFQLNKS